MEDINFRRNVEPEFRRKTNKSLGELGSLQQDYGLKSQQLSDADALLQREKQRMDDRTSELETARNELSDAQAEIDADYLPEGAQPRARIQARDNLIVKVQQSEAAFRAQESATRAATDAQLAAERSFFLAERALSRFAEGLEDVLRSKQIIADLDKQKNIRLENMEKQTTQRKMRTQRLEKEAIEAQRQAESDLKRTQAQTAKQLNKEAKKKVLSANALTLEMTSKINDLQEAHHRDRTEAVLELKANVDNVRAQVATQAEKYVKKQEQKKKQLEDEKAGLLAQGLNPYVEFRKKELAEEARSREKKLKSAVEKNKTDLSAQLAKEQTLIDKQDHARYLAAVYEKEHRESLGRHVVEERNRKYIVDRTADHTEVLDPSGKAARIDPSQITNIADFSFGLGKSARIPPEGMRRITEKIRQEMRVEKDDFGEYDRLVSALRKATGVADDQQSTQLSNEDQLARSMSAPAKTRTAAEDSHEENNVQSVNAADLRAWNQFGNTNGAIPASNPHVATVNLPPDEKGLRSHLLKLATEREGEQSMPISDKPQKQISAAEEAKYPIAPMSKFERDSLDRAKERQTERVTMGVPQIAVGREFTGDSFASTPSIICFKDFDVGQTYKQQFVLTNVSYTFNSFKLLELEDDILDFFVITFVKPGRMSAGMSCRIEIVFSPQVNRDIFSHIKLWTETGPVNVPLQCLIRRCAPRVMDSLVRFDELVVGQRAVQYVKLTNSQALPTRFIVERVLPTPAEKQSTSNSAEEMTLEEQPLDQEPALSPLQIDAESSNDHSANVDGSEAIGNDPAANEVELQSRVRRVMTNVWRRKQREQAQPFVCYLSSNKSLNPRFDDQGRFIDESHIAEVLVYEGVLNGYDSLQLTMRCAPLIIGELQETFRIRFLDVDEAAKSVDEQGKLVEAEQFVTAHVPVRELPIYVEHETIDLRCCLHDRIYRQQLTVHNRGKTALRLQMSVMKRFSEFIEVSPDLVFVQANASQLINIKFTPQRAMVRKAAHFSVPQEAYACAALMQLPIEIQVVNQDLPVYFITQALVTQSTIEISEPVLDFGKIYVGQRTIKSIKVRNTSMLPQKIAFVRLKKEFSVQPNEGFAVLLPLEELVFDVSFCPPSAIEYKLDLILQTSYNDKVLVPIIAEGIEAPIALSQSAVRMRTTCPGQRVIESVFVKNNLAVAQSIEFMPPDALYTWIKISPLATLLQPAESCRVEIEYCPPRDVVAVTKPSEYFDSLCKDKPTSVNPFDRWEEDDAGWEIGSGLSGEIQWSLPPHPVVRAAQELITQPSSKTNTENDDTAETETETFNPEEIYQPLPKEEWGIIGRWNIPILTKAKKRLGTTTSSNPAQGTISTQLGIPHKPLPLFISMESMVILPQIEAEVNELNFGSIAVATRQLKTFKIYNRSNHPIKLKGTGFNAVGPFSLLRPIRSIAPMESRVIIVECFPRVPGLITEMLEIQCEDESVGGHRLFIPCSVQGLMPMIALEGLLPAPSPIHTASLAIDFKETWSSRSGLLDFGHVMITSSPENNISTKKFVVKNLSTFPIDAIISRLSSKTVDEPRKRDELIERTAAGLPIIALRPERVNIQPGSKVEVEVVFRPDRYRFLPFREDFEVAVGDTDERLRVGVIGRAWTRQFNVIPDSPLDEPLMSNWLQATIGSAEDVLSNHYDESFRNNAREEQEDMFCHIATPFNRPPIVLRYPDAFDASAAADSYTLIDPASSGAAAPAKGGKGKDVPVAINPEHALRRQIKKLRIVTARAGTEVAITAAGAKGQAPSTFEVILSDAAKACGLFSFSVEKGTLTAGKDEVIDVLCTQAKPRMLGGVSVCSWKTFDATIVIKGGLYLPGEKDEVHLPVQFLAFVSI